jgi:hypothetical protein
VTDAVVRPMARISNTITVRGRRQPMTTIICTGETYKDHVKMTFAKGTSLDDPSGLFNATLKGNTWRPIDFHEGDTINAKALKALIREAVDLNTSD